MEGRYSNTKVNRPQCLYIKGYTCFKFLVMFIIWENTKHIYDL